MEQMVLRVVPIFELCSDGHLEHLDRHEPDLLIPPQTIRVPPPKLSLPAIMHCAYRSPGLLHTLRRPSGEFRANLDSSVKRTLPQSSSAVYWLNCFLPVVFGLFSRLLQHFWHYEAHFGAVVQLDAHPF
jgi:hypothetical protein